MNATSKFVRPNWVPSMKSGSRILICGGTGGLGSALVDMLLEGPDAKIGVHGASKVVSDSDPRLIPLQRHLAGEADCRAVVETFVAQAGGIDALVMLSGRIHSPGHWKEMPAEAWEADIDVNLNHAFFLARSAMGIMEEQGHGGQMILTGTESALHGGSSVSFPYAIAKRGTECLVQGLAREGAPHNIRVNGVRFGCIASGFHQRWMGKDDDDMKTRIELVPLKRAGHPDEAAALMVYLLSDWAGFITGQMIPLTGGDWL